jgi:hypothetical protein
MSPSPPSSTPRARCSRRHGIAWFATLADALSVDQYVKTRTALVENMLEPLAGSDTSSC